MWSLTHITFLFIYKFLYALNSQHVTQRILLKSENIYHELYILKIYILIKLLGKYFTGRKSVLYRNCINLNSLDIYKILHYRYYNITPVIAYQSSNNLWKMYIFFFKRKIQIKFKFIFNENFGINTLLRIIYLKLL